ncbi:MAG: carbon monoxide dehydrogenase subunit G [Anaerolineae bacterium]|nr:carbon monoxide dehydrogenase subunit G [Anaerolineae bacterium]
MDISGEFLFDVPRHLVWNMLQDPAVLEAVLPGGRNFKEVGDSEYTGELVIKVGPVQGTFQGKIHLSNFNAPESYWIEVNGSGATGVVKASGRLYLQARGDQTYMTYAGQADVGGRIASVGQRLLENAARSIIRQSLEALHEHMKAKIELPLPQSPVSTPNPVASNPALQAARADTSELSAQSSLRNGLNNIIPAQYQVWLLGGAIIVIALIIALLVLR